MTTIVHLKDHEPEHEAAQYLLELASEDDRYTPENDVMALRGETLAKLSFQVPDDVAEKFEAERASKWPVDDAGNLVVADDSTEAVDDDNDPSTPAKRQRAKPKE
jgi:hypothetical protein